MLKYTYNAVRLAVAADRGVKRTTSASWITMQHASSLKTSEDPEKSARPACTRRYCVISQIWRSLAEGFLRGFECLQTACWSCAARGGRRNTVVLRPIEASEYYNSTDVCRRSPMLLPLDKVPQIVAAHTTQERIQLRSTPILLTWDNSRD